MQHPHSKEHTHHHSHESHGGHDKHAGHSPDMFKNRFFVCLALTIPVLYNKFKFNDHVCFVSLFTIGSELLIPTTTFLN